MVYASFLTHRLILAPLAVLAVLAGAARGGEEIEIESKELAPGDDLTLLLQVRATRGQPIQAFNLAVKVDPQKVKIIDFLPAGDWIFNSPPDFVASAGTLEQPGQPGEAGLVVILDMKNDGTTKVIPPAAGGLKTIAELSIELLPGPGGGFPECPIPIEFEDGAVQFGPGPAMINSLVIRTEENGSQDYYEGSEEFPLVLRAGALFSLLRGDADFNCRRDLADVLWILKYLFLSGEEPPCLDLADVNNDGAATGTEAIDISDAIFLVFYLFLGAPEPDPGEGCIQP